MSSRKTRSVKRARVGRQANQGAAEGESTSLVPSPTTDAPPSITTIPNELATRIAIFAVCGKERKLRSSLVQCCKFLRDVTTSAPVARAFVITHWKDPISAILDLELKRRAMKPERGKYVLDVMEHAASLINYQNERHRDLLDTHTTDYFEGLCSLASLDPGNQRLNLSLLVLMVNIRLQYHSSFSRELKAYVGTLKKLRGTPVYSRYEKSCPISPTVPFIQ